MLIKQPKGNLNLRKWFVKGAAVVFVVEAAGLLVSYAFFNHLNKDRDFRLKVLQKFPLLLETYYKIDETLGEGKIRESDYRCWSREGNER